MLKSEIKRHGGSLLSACDGCCRCWTWACEEFSDAVDLPRLAGKERLDERTFAQSGSIDFACLSTSSALKRCSVEVLEFNVVLPEEDEFPLERSKPGKFIVEVNRRLLCHELIATRTPTRVEEYEEQGREGAKQLVAI